CADQRWAVDGRVRAGGGEGAGDDQPVGWGGCHHHRWAADDALFGGVDGANQLAASALVTAGKGYVAPSPAKGRAGVGFLSGTSWNAPACRPPPPPPLSPLGRGEVKAP